MIDLTATEIATFSCAVAGALLILALSQWLKPGPRIKSPSFYWSCGCAKAPVIADKPLVVRR
jgi:hypothetical protein